MLCPELSVRLSLLERAPAPILILWLEAVVVCSKYRMILHHPCHFQFLFQFCFTGEKRVVLLISTCWFPIVKRSMPISSTLAYNKLAFRSLPRVFVTPGWVFIACVLVKPDFMHTFRTDFFFKRLFEVLQFRLACSERFLGKVFFGNTLFER